MRQQRALALGAALLLGAAGVRAATAVGDWGHAVHGRKARLLLATWNGEPANVTLTVDAKALGFAPTKAADVRAETALPLADGKVTFDLEGYGTLLVDLE